MLKNLEIVIICVVCYTCYGAKDDFVHQRLIQTLLEGYLSIADPGSGSDTTNVTFEVSFTKFKLDETTGELTSYVWQRMSWQDRRLAWNPEQFNGVAEVRIPSGSIWIPDIVLYNSLTANVDATNPNVVVTNDGKVHWIPSIVYKTDCTQDPDSRWRCSLKFGSWSYDGFQLSLEEAEKGRSIDLSDYVVSDTLEIVDLNSKRNVVYYIGIDEPYVDITMSFVFRKHNNSS